MSEKQKTILKSSSCTGIGLHTGKTVTMTIRPAFENTGIVFHRMDVDKEKSEIKASWNNVVDTKLCTVLGNEQGTTIGTIEHLMAAFAGCEIDNAIVEVDAGELPIMDGSAAPFVTMIEKAGSMTQKAARKFIKILEPVILEDENGRIELAPAESFKVALDIDYAGSEITKQSSRVKVNPKSFKRDIASARTFCFAKDVEMLQSVGLARGGSLDNAVVVDENDKVVNEDGLRFDQEFVAHKILDCIGDLYLAGAPIIAKVKGSRIGHGYNNRILRALFANPLAWRYEEARVEEEPVKADHKRRVIFTPVPTPQPLMA
ncbi:MAG: UDP-3-O-acyl-N-acetylglucosamine deacetylase [Alphaproteobacteria bacterium]